MQVDDPRIPESFTMAKESGMSFTLEGIDLGDVHPNSVKMNLTGKSGRTLEVIAASVGGGQIQDCELGRLTAISAGIIRALTCTTSTSRLVAEVTSEAGAQVGKYCYDAALPREPGAPGRVMDHRVQTEEVPGEAIEWLEHLEGNFKGYLLKHAGSIETSDGQKDAAYVTGRRCEPSG